MPAVLDRPVDARLTAAPTPSQVAALWDDHFGPWSTTVEAVDHHGGGSACAVVVRGVIRHADAEVGTFRRRLERTDDGWDLHHDGIGISRDLRGFGFGGTWTARCIERYRAAGIGTVTLLAGPTYIWAACGFEFDHRNAETAHAYRDGLRKATRLVMRTATETDKVELGRLAQLLDATEAPTAAAVMANPMGGVVLTRLETIRSGLPMKMELN